MKTKLEWFVLVIGLGIGWTLGYLWVVLCR
jgi:hypothetical protein